MQEGEPKYCVTILRYTVSHIYPAQVTYARNTISFRPTETNEGTTSCRHSRPTNELCVLWPSLATLACQKRQAATASAAAASVADVGDRFTSRMLSFNVSAIH